MKRGKSISSNELPYELWKQLVAHGCRAKQVYVCMTHPDVPSHERPKSIRSKIVAEIVRRHYANERFTYAELESLFMVSRSLVEKAVSDAKKQLGLSSAYRYSRLKGGFQHKSEMKTNVEKRMRISRPERSIVRPEKKVIKNEHALGLDRPIRIGIKGSVED